MRPLDKRKAEISDGAFDLVLALQIAPMLARIDNIRAEQRRRIEETRHIPLRDDGFLDERLMEDAGDSILIRQIEKRIFTIVDFIKNKGEA